MLVSRDKRFIFVHIQKTAGTSIRRDLYAQIPDLDTSGGTHDGAREGVARLGEEFWNSAYSVAFVRNPWDRLVSWYSMIEGNRPKIPVYRIPGVKRPKQALWRYVLRRASTFEQFVDGCTDTIDDWDGKKSFVRPQTDFLCDASGERIVSFVGRFENLAEDYATVREHLGLEQRDLGHERFRSKHTHYSDYYTDRTRDIVAERFRSDIEAFGYEFEDRRGS